MSQPSLSRSVDVYSHLMRHTIKKEKEKGLLSQVNKRIKLM